jgi:hypothetical protein
MTTVQTVGAVSGAAAEWFAIDWQSVNRNVRRLQVRIVQAWKAGRWNKVKALQRLLTCSYSGKVSCRSTSDGKCGQENPRSGRRNLGHSGEEGTGSPCTEAERLSSSTAQTCLHPEKVRQQNDAPPRNLGASYSVKTKRHPAPNAKPHTPHRDRTATPPGSAAGWEIRKGQLNRSGSGTGSGKGIGQGKAPESAA